MQPIKAGIATYVGIAVGILTLIPPLATGIISEVENESVAWTSGDKTAAIVGGATIIVTLVGRFAQAVAQILKGR